MHEKVIYYSKLLLDILLFFSHLLNKCFDHAYVFETSAYIKNRKPSKCCLSFSSELHRSGEF